MNPDAARKFVAKRPFEAFAVRGTPRIANKHLVWTRNYTVSREVGPFGDFVRPFTVNGEGTLCFVNVNELLGFEIGDTRTGKMLQRVVVQGFEKGATKRHGCPSHGIGLTPDEREIWLTDAHNRRVHIFDGTTMPPAYVASIELRDEPGWITFSIDGRYGYPSTGDVVEVATRKIVAGLKDEKGAAVQSEKMLEIDFADGKPVRAGDQFGVGRARIVFSNGPTTPERKLLEVQEQPRRKGK